MINFLTAPSQLEVVIKIAAIILGTLLVNSFLRKVFKKAFAQIPSKRAKTLLSISQNATTAVVFTIASFTLLSELGINITPLLTSAGIIGFAISFGSQSLIRDLIAGVFLLIEDTVREGETVQVAGIKGVVTRIGIRTITLKDSEGTLHIVPNGIIKAVSNFSRKS